MRTAMPLLTCSRITERGPSATWESISTPRLMGPGCMTMASGLAVARRSSVRPKSWKYSCSLGSMAPRMRSRWRRSMMTTSASRTPSRRSWKTRAPRDSGSAGSRVRGAMMRTSPAPRVLRAASWERATRECKMSPTIATVSWPKSPLCRRMVNMSSMPWVGWEWRPSPALMTLTPGATCWAIKWAAPLSAWRTTNMSTCMASRLRRVSSRVSPLDVEEAAMLRVSTSADSRLAANSKVVRVRVLVSKKRLATVLPRHRGTFFTAWRATPRKPSVLSRILIRSSRLNPSRVRKCLRWP